MAEWNIDKLWNMTNNQVVKIIAKYHSGIRSDSLKNKVITAINHFSNKTYDEPEVEDLEGCDSEDTWKNAISWLERHAKNI